MHFKGFVLSNVIYIRFPLKDLFLRVCVCVIGSVCVFVCVTFVPIKKKLMIVWGADKSRPNTRHFPAQHKKTATKNDPKFINAH